MTHEEERAAIAGITMGVLVGLLVSIAACYAAMFFCLLIGQSPWSTLMLGTALLIFELSLYLRKRKDIKWAGEYAKQRLSRCHANDLEKKRETQANT